jgi:hypothetical protein
MHNTITTELISVSDKFKPQVGQFLAVNPMIEGHEVLQERIKKASAYFAEKTDLQICKILLNTEIETDNKAIRKVLRESFENLYQEAFIKTECFKACMADGFTVKNYLGAKAKAALEKIQLKPERKAKTVSILGGKSETGLLQEIKTWRAAMADEEDLPVYMVLPQKTMYDLAERLPVTLKELKAIKGFGKKKVLKYGDDLIRIIRNYLQVNHLNKMEVDLSDDEPEQKPKKEKGQTQRLSLGLFKQGKSIEDIAKERSLTISTIGGHLSGFVARGELDILQLITQEKLDLITSYFKNAETASLSEALAALGNKVSYWEMKMVLGYLQNS